MHGQLRPLPFRPRVTASESLQQLSTPSLPTACHRERESAAAFDPFPSDRVSPRARVCRPRGPLFPSDHGSPQEFAVYRYASVFRPSPLATACHRESLQTVQASFAPLLSPRVRSVPVARVGEHPNVRVGSVPAVSAGHHPTTGSVPVVSAGERPRARPVPVVSAGEHPRLRPVPVVSAGERPRLTTVPS